MSRYLIIGSNEYFHLICEMHSQSSLEWNYVFVSIVHADNLAHINVKDI